MVDTQRVKQKEQRQPCLPNKLQSENFRGQADREKENSFLCYGWL